MAKVTINGEVFQWDASRKPMSEALAIEAGMKCRYADWETDLQGGSARALAGFIWLVWRRNGRDEDLAKILAGEVDIDLDGLSIDDDEGEAADPTSPSPGRSPTTGTGTSASSRKSSTSAHGKSGS